MRCLFIIMLFTFVLQANAEILITSESSAKLRVFQDAKILSEGKIFLENSGVDILKNLKLNIMNAVNGTTIIPGNCGDTLLPNQTCYFILQYKPSFTNLHQVKDFLVTLIVTALAPNNQKQQDSYTIVLESVPHGNWVKFGGENSLEIRGTRDFTQKQHGNASLLYAASGHVLRSSDGQHWSVVGNNFPVNCNVDKLAVGKDYLYAYSDCSGMQKYDGISWVALKNIPWLDRDKFGGINKMLVTPDNVLYIATSIGGVIKLEGENATPLGGDSWQEQHLGNALAIIQDKNDSRLYAATDKGVAQFDGNQWEIIGKKEWFKQRFLSAFGVYQDAAGNLYAAANVGILQYKNEHWQLLGDAKNGLTGYIQSKFLVDVNDLYVGTNDGLNDCNLFRYDGKHWSKLDSPCTYFNAFGHNSNTYSENPVVLYVLLAHNGRLYASTDRAILIYDRKANQWLPANTNWNGIEATALAPDTNGGLYAWWQHDLVIEGHYDTSWGWRPSYAPIAPPTYYSNRYGLQLIPKDATRPSTNSKRVVFTEDSIPMPVAIDSWNKVTHHNSANSLLQDHDVLYAGWANCSSPSAIIAHFPDKKSYCRYAEPPVGGVLQYAGQQWMPVGAKSWSKETQDGVSTRLLKVNGTLYSAWLNNTRSEDYGDYYPIGGVLQYDGKNWLPLGYSSWNFVYANDLLLMNNRLYAATSDGVVEYYP
ncbi:MAG TPA: hypothetical protein VHE99_05365 [Gammaproteobacteria bacterium]|nr:hypothetical protein [Gammaproteobacteria bacterium]